MAMEDMMKDMTLKINVETDGAGEAREKIDGLARSLQMLPPQVTVRDCHSCKIEIYPSQTVWLADGGEDDDETDRI